jgi:sulfur relay (sulfurtransferase) DsrF/TusC family protein
MALISSAALASGDCSGFIQAPHGPSAAWTALAAVPAGDATSGTHHVALATSAVPAAMRATRTDLPQVHDAEELLLPALPGRSGCR